jgi:hypothetical protein
LTFLLFFAIILLLIKKYIKYMSESPHDTSSTSIRDLLAARLQELEGDLSPGISPYPESVDTVNIDNEAATKQISETGGVLGETAIAGVKTDIASKLFSLRTRGEEIKAERQRVLDEAAAKAKRLREEAAKLEAQRANEIAIEEERKQRELDEEIKHRIAIEENEADARQGSDSRSEDTVKFDALSENVTKEDTNSAPESSDEPDTLEYPVGVIIAPKTLDNDLAIDSEVKAKKRRNRSLTVVATIVALGLGGSAAATDYDTEAVDHTKTYLEKIMPGSSAHTSKNPSARIKPFTASLPAKHYKVSESSSLEHDKKAEPKPEAKKSQDSQPVPIAKSAIRNPRDESISRPPSSLPTATPRKVVKSESEKSVSKPEAKKTPTSEEAQPVRRSAVKEPSGGAEYGDTSTGQGGVSPLIAP